MSFAKVFAEVVLRLCTVAFQIWRETKTRFTHYEHNGGCWRLVMARRRCVNVRVDVTDSERIAFVEMSTAGDVTTTEFFLILRTEVVSVTCAQLKLYRLQPLRRLTAEEFLRTPLQGDRIDKKMGVR